MIKSNLHHISQSYCRLLFKSALSTGVVSRSGWIPKLGSTKFGPRKLEISLHRTVLIYLQRIISFWHNTRVWRTDRQISTAIARSNRVSCALKTHRLSRLAWHSRPEGVPAHQVNPCFAGVSGWLPSCNRYLRCRYYIELIDTFITCARRSPWRHLRWTANDRIIGCAGCARDGR